MNRLTLDQLTLENFSLWQKTKFRVPLDPANTVELELSEVNTLLNPGSARAAANQPAQESFSLIFHGPKDHFLPQRMYTFEHDRIGRFELFIVPIGQKSGLFHYQAVFNRLIKPA
jgi:hypothetical protein